MTHPRKLIRDAIVSLLKGTETGCGQRVFSNRGITFKPENLPAINVLTTDEPKISEDSSSARRMRRELEVEIEILGKDANDESLDDTLDAIAEIVESIMGKNETLSNTANDSWLTKTSTSVRSEGQKPLGGLSITYTVVYFTQHTAGDDDLDTFEVGHYAIRPAGKDANTPTAAGDVTPEQAP